jgi:hypothetical protein
MKLAAYLFGELLGIPPAVILRYVPGKLDFE